MTMNDTPDLPSNPEELDAYDMAQDNADLDHMEQMDADEPEDQFMSDAEADADVLASAGMGTDEDYGGGCDHLGDGDW
jgi:hypothetical protein